MTTVATGGWQPGLLDEAEIIDDAQLDRVPPRQVDEELGRRCRGHVPASAGRRMSAKDSTGWLVLQEIRSRSTTVHSQRSTAPPGSIDGEPSRVTMSRGGRRNASGGCNRYRALIINARPNKSMMWRGLGRIAVDGCLTPMAY